MAKTQPPEVGGQGMPKTLATAVDELFYGANNAMMIYPGLALGAGELIEAFGTDKQKELYLKKMYTGEWGGSMLLTEPEAGSDVGVLTTTAVPNDDGSYSITGNKIFITGAEQNLTGNIIHPVLARIEGAPEGTKGISLFLVPKILVNDDGSLGDKNDIAVTGIEHKMGLCASATCSVTLGGKGTCRGTLLGAENKGMGAMFKMMNYARLGTGIQGFAMASSAYLHALNYTRARVQGKSLLSAFDKNAPSVAIINHPDVRRMLMDMKAHVDGMRSLVYYMSKCLDLAKVMESGEEKDFNQGMVDLLMPVVKAYCTDKAMEITTTAVQCFGGYGYTKEYPVEQLMRDCKITQIYEGTSGIQAADLLGRKLAMQEGKLFMDFLGEIQKTVSQSRDIPILKELADKVEEVVNQLGQTAMQIGKSAMSDKVLTAFSHAHPFLTVMGDIIMAWMHLWRATIAVPKLEKAVGSLDPAERRAKAEKNKEVAFYEGLVTTTEFYIKTVLPIVSGKMQSIQGGSDAAVAMPVLSFGEL